MTELDSQRADLELLAHGAVTLFWKERLLNEAIASLRALDYAIIDINCSTKTRFINALSSGLRWNDQFGYEPWTGNLNAFRDALRFPFPDERDQLAICFRQFHLLAAEDSIFAHAILDELEFNSRDLLVRGGRLIGLVQTDDSEFSAPELGSRSANWNWAEWLDRNRC